MTEKLRIVSVHGSQENTEGGDAPKRPFSLVEEIARLRAENERLRAALHEYACTGTDDPCGCYSEFLRDKDATRAALEAAAGGQTMPNPPNDLQEFRRIIDELQEWRDRDHADGVRLSRHEIIVLLEGIYTLRRRTDNG